MRPQTKSPAWLTKLFGTKKELRAVMLEVLHHRYVREEQQAMHYRQHAERMRYPQFREVLLRLAGEEEKHAELIASKIRDLRDQLPNVIPIHVANEPNSWFYLRADLEEEQRCATESRDDLPTLGDEFPDIVNLLERIESDCKRHRAQLRDMLARSDPQAAVMT